MKITNKKAQIKGFITTGEHIKKLATKRPDIYKALKNPSPRVCLAWNVMEARHKMGQTQEGLAAKSGVSPRTVQYVENLDSHFSPKLDVITSIAKGLGVEVSDLLRTVDMTKA